MMNVSMIQTRSSDARSWRLKELDGGRGRGTPKDRSDCVRGISKVLVCCMTMLRIGINGGKLGKPTHPGLAAKCPLKRHVWGESKLTDLPESLKCSALTQPV